MLYDDFAISHDAENILAANKLYLDTDFVENFAILEEDVGMQTTHHVKLSTLTCKRTTYNKNIVSWHIIVTEIYRVHRVGLIFVE